MAGRRRWWPAEARGQPDRWRGRRRAAGGLGSGGSRRVGGAHALLGGTRRSACGGVIPAGMASFHVLIPQCCWHSAVGQDVLVECMPRGCPYGLVKRGQQRGAVEGLVLEHGVEDVAATACQTDQRGIVLLCPQRVCGRSRRDWSGRVTRRKRTEQHRLSLRLPDRAGCSPRIDEPERWVTGRYRRRPPDAPPEANAEPSPTSSRIRAAVLTPTPGIDIRTWERGWSSSILPHLQQCSCAVAEPLSRNLRASGRTISAALLPGTVTLWASSAVRISSASRAPIRRGMLWLRGVVSRRLPALRMPTGPPHRDRI